MIKIAVFFLFLIFIFDMYIFQHSFKFYLRDLLNFLLRYSHRPDSLFSFETKFLSISFVDIAAPFLEHYVFRSYKCILKCTNKLL